MVGTPAGFQSGNVNAHAYTVTLYPGRRIFKYLIGCPLISVGVRVYTQLQSQENGFSSHSYNQCIRSRNVRTNPGEKLLA